jgi:hypothetical protein
MGESPVITLQAYGVKDAVYKKNPINAVKAVIPPFYTVRRIPDRTENSRKNKR